MSEDKKIIDTEVIVSRENKSEGITTLQKKIRRGLIASAFYEFLIAILLISLPYLVIEVLRLDMLVLFTIGNAGTWFVIGGMMLVLIFLQVIYGIFINKLNSSKSGKVFGYIIGFFMCLNFPTGTFFGLILLQYLKEPKNNQGNNSKNEVTIRKISENEIQNSLGKFICITGILMLHMPIILLLINKFMIGLPLDMAYPIISSSLYDDWDLMMWIFFIIFSVQIIMGMVYIKKGNNKWVKIAIIPFAVFQIISLGIAINGFVIAIWPGLGIDASMNIILYIVWIFGVILNPLGIYFGVGILKGLKIKPN